MLPRAPSPGHEKGIGGGHHHHHARGRRPSASSHDQFKHLLLQGGLPPPSSGAPPGGALGGLAGSADVLTEDDVEDEEIKQLFSAVFHITTTAVEPEYEEPWATFASVKSTGTGFAIDFTRRWIMTNHHVIADATVIQLHRNEDFRMYRAKVLCSDEVTDLALITVEDDKFWTDDDVYVVEFQQSDDYRLNTPVTVLGHPLGDKNLSITQGVISKYCCISYSPQATILMPAIHVSAAINGGNSGGPVVNAKSGKCVGVAFAAYSSADDVQNVGLVIPTIIIKRFITDYLKHGQFTGYYHSGFNYQTLEAPALRKALSVPEGVSGVLVTEVFPPVCQGKLQLNDVVMALDGHNIGDDATIKFRRGERQSFELLLCQKSKGDTLTFKVLRDGKEESVSFPLLTSPTRLIPHKPKLDYFIVGGLAFLPLSQQVEPPAYMGGGGGGQSTTGTTSRLTCSDEQIVILAQIIAHEVNSGYALPMGADPSGQSFETPVRLLTFNGQSVRNIDHLISLVEGDRTGQWLRFEFEDPQLRYVHLEAQAARQATKEILVQNNISSTKPRKPRQAQQPAAAGKGGRDGGGKAADNNTQTKKKKQKQPKAPGGEGEEVAVVQVSNGEMSQLLVQQPEASANGSNGSSSKKEGGRGRKRQERRKKEEEQQGGESQGGGTNTTTSNSDGHGDDGGAAAAVAGGDKGEGGGGPSEGGGKKKSKSRRNRRKGGAGNKGGAREGGAEGAEEEEEATTTAPAPVAASTSTTTTEEGGADKDTTTTSITAKASSSSSPPQRSSSSSPSRQHTQKEKPPAAPGGGEGGGTTTTEPSSSSSSS